MIRKTSKDSHIWKYLIRMITKLSFNETSLKLSSEIVPLLLKNPAATGKLFCLLLGDKVASEEFKEHLTSLVLQSASFSIRYAKIRGYKIRTDFCLEIAGSKTAVLTLCESDVEWKEFVKLLKACERNEESAKSILKMGNCLLKHEKMEALKMVTLEFDSYCGEVP